MFNKANSANCSYYLRRLHVVSGLFNRKCSTRRVAGFLGLSLALIILGCGQSPQPTLKVFPVKGVVNYKNKGVANAEIALFPQGGGVPETVRPRAKTAEDGTFTVWTYQAGDGAPAGNYKVTVVRNNIIETKGVAIAQPNDLPPKYATVQSTTLVAEIGEKETELPPIELK